MNKRTALFALLMGVALVGFGCSQEAEDTTTTNTSATTTEEEVMEKDDAMEKEEDKMMEEETEAAMEKEDEDMAMEKDENEVMEKEEVMEEGLVEPVPSEPETEEVMEKEETEEPVEAMEKEEEAAAPGTYTTYSESAVSSAASNGDAVLFFHASWCPTCKALDDDINASTADIPAGLTIFKTDYDSNTDLRKKYGVTYQHTMVQVDANGDMITKWSGGNTLESIVSKVQ